MNDARRIDVHGADEKMTANAAKFYQWLSILAENFKARPEQSLLALTNEEKVELVDEFLSEISQAKEHAQITGPDLRRLIPELVKHLKPELIRPGELRNGIFKVFTQALHDDKYLAAAVSAGMEDWENLAIHANNLRVSKARTPSLKHKMVPLDRWSPNVFSLPEVRYFLMTLALHVGIEPKIRKTKASEESHEDPCLMAMGAA